MPTKSNPQESSVSQNPFVDFPSPPGPADIRRALGRSTAAWDALKSGISEHFGHVTEEWKISAKKYGWSLRLKHKNRTILHLGPRSRHFIVAVILGEKAVAGVRESALSPEVVAMVENATKYPEGRLIRFEIRSKKEIEVVIELAKIKMDN